MRLSKGWDLGDFPPIPHLLQPGWCCRGCLIFLRLCFSFCKMHRRKLPSPVPGFAEWGWKVLYWRQVGSEQMDEKCLSPSGALRGPLAELSSHPGAPCFNLKQHLEFHPRSQQWCQQGSTKDSFGFKYFAYAASELSLLFLQPEKSSALR